VTLVLNGADEEQEGPRTRVSHRLVLHVQESGRDWQNAIPRAIAAFRGTHPDARALSDWSMSSRIDQRLVALETSLVEAETRICQSTRTSTAVELVVLVDITLEGENDAYDLDDIAEDAREAVDDLFSKDAIALAAHSPGHGVVLSSIRVDEARQTDVRRLTEGEDGAWTT
jgi:hypothetical protein